MARRVRAEEPELKRSDDVGATAHYDDPDYYDKAYRDRRDDVAYYVRLGRLSGGPVLEYGIGTGRIAVELARAGVAVTGIDRSRPMLDGLARRLAAEPAEVRSRVRAVEGDMRSLRLRKRFPLVIAAFNTVLHLNTLSDVESFFERVRGHLAAGGRFVFDFSVPHPDYLGADPDRRFGAPRFRHPHRGLVRYKERFEYDVLKQVLLMDLEFSPVDGSPGWIVPLHHRQFFPQEMAALLRYNGFPDVVWTADFTDAPPDDDVDSLVASCGTVAARRGRRGRIN